METMKRKWGKPVTEVQSFTPQEFVAQCIKVGKGGLNGHWSENNKMPGLQEQPVNPNATGNEHFKAYLEAHPEVELMNDGRIATDQLHSNAEGWFPVRLAPGEWPQMIETHPDFQYCVGYQANQTRYWLDVNGVYYYQNWSVDESAYTNFS